VAGSGVKPSKFASPVYGRTAPASATAVYFVSHAAGRASASGSTRSVGITSWPVL
jgi:hypothetical protein